MLLGKKFLKKPFIKYNFMSQALLPKILIIGMNAENYHENMQTCSKNLS